MKVVYLTSVSPWNTTFGGGIRNAGILRGLTRHHRVEVVFFTAERGMATGQPPPGVERLHVISLRPDGVRGRWWNPAARRAARQRCADIIRRVDPDVVWCFQKAVARLGGIPREQRVVVDFADVSRRRLARAAAQQHGAARVRTLFRIAASWADDHWLGGGADVTVLANACEAALLPKQQTVRAVPNGTDFPARPTTPRASKRILHLGGLWYGPNLDGLRWFLLEVWPRVLAAEPDARLDVVGGSAPPGARIAAQHVTWCGYLDDLAAAFAASALLVVPLRIGAGTRTKVLEAWASGVPVASTSVGVEGLDVRDGETALIGDTPAALADACLRLLLDPALGGDMAARAFEHGREHFSWDAIYPALDDVLLSAVSGARRAAALPEAGAARS